MIYVTGDCHGDFRRFNTEIFTEQKEMTKNDTVIILGDFGGVWDFRGESRSEKYWLDWLDKKPFTTVFIDGNHECFSRLYQYPIKEWREGKVHEIRPSVLHLMRGEIFTIEKNTFFAFGGASSHDINDGILDPVNDASKIKDWYQDYTKMFRINGISWWKEELPSQEEMNNGLLNLQKVNNKVDYIITHSPYTSLLRQMDGGSGLYENDYLTDYLQKIKQTVDYKYWLFGHMHVNQTYHWERSSCLYEQIIRVY